MNREDIAMDLTFENLDILRKEVQAAKLLLSECDKVLEEDGGVYIELRAFLSGKMSADDVIALLASQQGEQAKLCTKPDCFPHCDCGSADDKAQPSPAPELERGSIHVEARECIGCGHSGINDAADGFATCSACAWIGKEPVKDECPKCQRENVMSAACPMCHCRYILIADGHIKAPVAQAGQVPDGWRVMRCTSSAPRDGDKWEIYDPQGSGGVVSVHDVKDWAVRGLLDALAATPAQGGRDE